MGLQVEMIILLNPLYLRQHCTLINVHCHTWKKINQSFNQSIKFVKYSAGLHFIRAALQVFPLLFFLAWYPLSLGIMSRADWVLHVK